MPFLRFGGIESECAVKCDNSIFGIPVNADETPKLYWLWKNLGDFGCDVIGYCQYRRFFTKVNTRVPILMITRARFSKDMAMEPAFQEAVIRSHKVDGILHPAIPVVNRSLTPFKYVWEQIAILEQDKMCPLGKLKTVFDIFLSHTPADLKPFMEKAFLEPNNYLCNIFTVKSDVFKLFGDIAFVSVRDVLSMMTPDEKKRLHPYWLAYLFERYTSCFYHCLELSGKCRFAKVPLMTLDADKHIEWKQPDV